jgi:hypothetical protein
MKITHLYHVSVAGRTLLYLKHRHHMPRKPNPQTTSNPTSTSALVLSQDESQSPKAARSSKAKASLKDRTVWSLEDEGLLISLVKAHQMRAGDGASYRKEVWEKVAAGMSSSEGPTKNWASCKSKWSRVCLLRRFF